MVEHDVSCARDVAIAVVFWLRDAAGVALFARGVVGYVAHAHVVVHAPAEVLVEGGGFGEHPLHVSDAVDRPTTDILVKG